MRVTTAAEMRQLDRLAIDTYGIPGAVLMENAGAQVVRLLWQEYPDLQTRRVAVLCGRGNNGGDGFVIARYLHNAGVSVAAFLMGEQASIRGEARVHLDILTRLGVAVQEVTTAEAVQHIRAQLSAYDLLIDALLGTGLNAEVSGSMREMITAMNAAGRPIVSVDIPSGLSADAGARLGEHIRADLTVTIGLPKRGLLLYPAAEHVGKLVVVDIGFPAAVREHESVRCHLLLAHEIARLLHARRADTHKGTYGHVLVVAGGIGKTGAGALASLAALRSGAGLVTWAVPQSLNAAMEAKLTEIMTVPMPECDEGLLGAAAAKRILEWLDGMSALVIGPGLGTHPETVRCVHEVLRHAPVPAVVDADGINALALHPDVAGEARAPRILTPHPGELARLCKTTTATIQADRLVAAQDTARAHAACVVLKGAHTIIAEPQGTVYINPTGNPGMATAGTGDVLSGMIGAFIGQGFDPGTAARVGVFVHGLAGDLAAAKLGERSMAAGDVIDALPRAFQQLQAVKQVSHPNGEHHWIMGRPGALPRER
ncbi:MAG: NAD(P)H-hydrate dehydratase [Nitrospinae bacterium]|nr:NAD(P)H-hydrate dehydratase [Nitrospinota bacterium]